MTVTLVVERKHVDAAVRRLTATAAGTAGSHGASYEQMGAVWGITRQGARKKWPDAVVRTPATASAALELFGGTAELTLDPSSRRWTWTGRGADGEHGAAGADTGCATREEAAAHAGYATREEAAAHAGAFLQGHTAP